MAQSIYLIASGGNPNYGDELIIKSWLRFLAQTRPDSIVWLDCPQPGTASALFAGLHRNFRPVNTLWRSCAEAPDQSAGGVWDHLEKIVTHGGTPMYDAGLLALRQAESLHLLGGGYINGVWPDHVGLVSGMLAARKLTGCRLVASGLGLMPLPENAGQIRAAFAEFESISVRDKPSAEFLGGTSGIDDVFLGLLHEMALFRQSKLVQARAKDVMVCVQSDMTDEHTFLKLKDKLRVAVRTSLDNGLSVGYAEAIPGSDRRMFDALEGLIPKENFVPFTQIWADGLPVRQDQQWYTSRFHPQIIGAAAGAKGVAIGILDNYYDVKHGSLLDNGTGWAYSSANDDSPLPLPSGSASFSRKTLDMATAKRTEALALYPVS